ncbi:unnamed protein product [Amoebophrya sp. A25]|nr:unnamed protein product [Amoebophrya sp. A25]|eukprot:GSA25T00023107001.1
MMMLFFFLVFLLRRGERMLASCIVFMLREDVGVLFAVGKKHAAAAKAEEGAGKEAAEQRAWDTDCAQLLPGGWVGAAEGHGAEDALACYLPKDLYDAGLEEEVDCKTLSRGTKGWICYTSEMMRAGAFAKYKDTKHTETMDRAKVAADKQEGIQGKFARKRAIAWLLAGGKAKFKALEKRREQYAKAVADKEKVAENRVLSSWRRDVMPALTGRYVDESTGTAKWEEVPEDQRNSCTCPGGEEGERQDESGEEERGKVKVPFWRPRTETRRRAKQKRPETQSSMRTEPPRREGRLPCLKPKRTRLGRRRHRMAEDMRPPATRRETERKKMVD